MSVQLVVQQHRIQLDTINSSLLSSRLPFIHRLLSLGRLSTLLPLRPSTSRHVVLVLATRTQVRCATHGVCGGRNGRCEIGGRSWGEAERYCPGCRMEEAKLVISFLFWWGVKCVGLNDQPASKLKVHF